MKLLDTKNLNIYNILKHAETQLSNRVYFCIYVVTTRVKSYYVEKPAKIIIKYLC